MTKYQFLKELESKLSVLSQAEREEVLSDYEEHFLDAVASGKTEAEVSQTLGNPSSIAKELTAGYHVEKANESGDATSVIRAVLAVGSLGFFNLVVVLGPAVAVYGVLFSFWAVALVLIASPILVLISIPFLIDGSVLNQLFLSLTMSGIGILLALGLKVVTKIVLKITMKYLEFNKKIIRGERI